MKPAQSHVRYRYADYLTWPDDERWELIGGVPYAMVPVPTIRHQTIQKNLTTLLATQFRGKPCRPFPAPTDVTLSEEDVVQPDALVVCDRSKLTERAVVGAPDLVVEIASPSSESRDRRDKKALYERVGVPEYWLISPHGFVEQFSLGADGRYGPAVLIKYDEVLESSRFPDWQVPVAVLFEDVDLEIAEQPPPPYTEAALA